MPLLREGLGVTILGVRSVFIAAEDTRVAALEYGPEGITGASWRRASPLDPRPPTPPAVKVEAVLLEFDGIRVETGDPEILGNLHDPEWRKAFASRAYRAEDITPDPEETAA